MARSIFRRLNRRYGTIASLEQRLRAPHPGIDPINPPAGAAAPSEGAAETPVDRVDEAFKQLDAKKPFQGKTLAVIGGGFAGLSAAYAAWRGGAYVTLYEATPHVGGRVQSDSNTIAAGRIIERGAELIGTIHPVWLYYARLFGLGMINIDDETYFDAAGFDPDYVLDGVRVPSDRLEDLYNDFDAIQTAIYDTAKIINANAPWTTRPELDQVAFQDWITAEMKTRPPLAYERSLELFLAEMENDNVVPTAQQSALGFLALVAAGGEVKGRPLFFTDVELFRCDRGNHALADCLLGALTQNKMEIMTAMPIGKIVIHTAGRVDLYGYVNYVFNAPYWGTPNPHDYVVFAAPPVLNQANAVVASLDTTPFAMPATRVGNAVKVHLRRSSRFWLDHRDEPGGAYFLSGAATTGLGQMWEATSNQALLSPTAGDPVVLSVFTGSRGAEAAIAHAADIKSFYTTMLNVLQPGWADGVDVFYSQINTIYSDQNVRQAYFPGYSCPAQGEVTTKMKDLNAVIAGKFAYAGEHASPGFFGYMEGALASGLNAVLRLGGLSTSVGAEAELAAAET